MGNKIEVYSTPTCGKCMMLKKILDSKGIEYDVIDDMDLIIKKSKEMNTTELPLMTVVNGDDSIKMSGIKAVGYAEGL